MNPIAGIEKTSGLLAGKRGLIMGVANDKSIAWGMAQAMARQGAELAFTFQGDSFRKRIEPLAETLGSKFLMSCDVSKEAEVERTFAQIGETWGSLDFVVHAIAYSNKEELKGRYLDTTLDNFLTTMHLSCYSFTQVAQKAAPLMTEGGSLITLSYLGAQRVIPNYNVMGVAKAALEASVRYLARDLGPDAIRVNAVSAGPMRTLAGSAIGGARRILQHNKEQAPLRRTAELEDLGGAGVYLVSDLSRAVTGEVHYVDCGYNIIGVPDQVEQA